MFLINFVTSLLVFSSITGLSQSIPLDWQSTIKISSYGFEYSPVDYSALFLAEDIVKSLMICAVRCHSNSRCRIFDYNDQSYRCRLFEGNTNGMGSIINSLTSFSRVGVMYSIASYYINRGQPCIQCQKSRYLTCSNGTCQCPMNTYFVGSICQNQKSLGNSCFNSTECRQDLNYTCLPRQQCGPLSIQSGITVGGYGNGTEGTALNAFKSIVGLAMDYKSSLYVGDFGNHRVIRLEEGSLNGTVVAGNEIAGNALTQMIGPRGVYVDMSLNVYVADSFNDRITRWRINSSVGTIVAGNGTKGNTTRLLYRPSGVVVDSMLNLYVSDTLNNRIMKWAPNATFGTIIAGTGIPGSSNTQFDNPYGLYLDEINSLLYIADLNNHRIQLCDLNNTANITTVAGGNGPGSGPHQLYSPRGVRVSKKTRAIYIADTLNHRIQRWNLGATTGVTIVGITGLNGTSATLLSSPFDLLLSKNESYLYVTDLDNRRVQRFQLI